MNILLTWLMMCCFAFASGLAISQSFWFIAVMAFVCWGMAFVLFMDDVMNGN